MAEEISRLKRQPGKDIMILGSGALVRSLLRDGLLDELTLMVHTVVLGSGERLFEGRNSLGRALNALVAVRLQYEAPGKFRNLYRSFTFYLQMVVSVRM